MEASEWRKCLDKYINTGKLLSEEYEQMDEWQKFTIQELKKSYKRLNYEPVAGDYINDKYKIQ
jgi:hypothetical protein